MAVSQSLSVTEVADSINVVDNTNKVKIVWKSTQTGESWNGYTRTAYYWVSINGGEETKYSVSYTLPLNSTKTILSKTITVPHKSDGSGSVKVRTWMDTDISAGVVELSKSLTLTTIPRASTIDSLSCATAYLTGKMTYKYTPKSAAMYNRCNVSLHLDDEYIAVRSHIDFGKKAASQQTATLTLTEDELKTVYDQLPAAKEGTLRFTFRTYSDSGYENQVGDAGYKEITLKIPEDSTTKPTVGMSLTPVHSLADAFSALYIQGKSRVKVKLEAVPKFEADIEGYSVKIGTTTAKTTPTYTSGYLTQSGSITVYGYATDSREFTGSASQKINVLPYSAPKILNVTAVRCDEDGNEDDSGTYLKIHAKRSYAKVLSGSTQKNFCLIRYCWKAEGGSYSDWTTILAKTAASDEVTTGALLGSLAVDTTYQVQVQAIDDIGDHAETVITVPTEEVYMHRTKNAMGLGKYAEGERVLDVGWDAHFRGEVMIGDMTLREYIQSIIEGG